MSFCNRCKRSDCEGCPMARETKPIEITQIEYDRAWVEHQALAKKAEENDENQSIEEVFAYFNEEEVSGFPEQEDSADADIQKPWYKENVKRGERRRDGYLAKKRKEEHKQHSKPHHSNDTKKTQDYKHKKEETY